VAQPSRMGTLAGFRPGLAFLSKEVTDAVGLLTPSAC